MTRASDFLDMDRMDALVEDGFVTRREHPDAPLRVFNYTAKCQYEHLWAPETLAARGLILNFAGGVVARPFPKFFNLSEHEPESSNLPRLPLGQPFIASEKMDGSLGIAFRNPFTLRVEFATRGSFVSDQARWAQEWWDERFGYFEIPTGQTWLFEIVYPANRIVVNYGQRAELVLLAVIDIETGADLPLPSWGGATARQFDAATIDSLLAMVDDPQNFEGFVLRFPSTGQRVKVKLDEYVRLHRILTSCSSRTIWEALSSGTGLGDILDHVPDEFYRWVREQAAEIQGRYDAILQSCIRLSADDRVNPADRKATAAFFTQQAHPPVLFKMLDGKDASPLIWKAVRPEFERPFVAGPDEVAA
jgi:RNA ligase